MVAREGGQPLCDTTRVPPAQSGEPSLEVREPCVKLGEEDSRAISSTVASALLKSTSTTSSFVTQSGPVELALSPGL